MSLRLPCALLNNALDLTSRMSSVMVTNIRHNYTHIEFALSTDFKLKYRALPHAKSKDIPPRVKVPSEFRHVYPEFLPTRKLEHRNNLAEKLERMDMLNRRKKVVIPEFYIGSIMAVTVNDAHATDKSTRFVGICIDRGGAGLKAWFILRNHIDHQGMEIKYEMYCPVIENVETLRLEKRLDRDLLYLRDALPEYNTYPLDMEADLIAEGTDVPINDIKVKMKPRPIWHKKWELHFIKGIDFGELTDEQEYQVSKRTVNDILKFDLMQEYRNHIPEEEQEAIFHDVAPHYPALRATQRQYRRRKVEDTKTKGR